MMAFLRAGTEAWRFSFRQAWRLRFARAVSLVFLSELFVWSLFSFMRVLLSRSSFGSVILHENVYFGIDQQGTMGWVVGWPLLACGVQWVTLLIAIGCYRRQPEAATALFLLFIAWTVMASMALLAWLRLNT
jgi:hypothetical protein